ncbi:MmgE/PrpD family protein [Streptomyces mirabilis]|uniref:MmgE/PrpD family protein n=1 Tax=Streptomyces mirabilis TaxID=68239 RepID=UPI00332E235F
MVIPGVKEPVTPVKTGRPATYPDGPTGTLATWVARMTLDDVPAPTRERARYLILDGIGCALVGAKLPDSSKGVGAQMNVAYAVAVALLDGKVLIDQFTADRIAGADVWNLIDRTMTRHDAKYDELPVTQRLTTRVAATLKDGSVRDKTVVHPRGSGDRLLTNDEIVEKYRDLTRTVVSAERQSAIESAILGLENMADISELVALLTPTVRAATD